MSQLIRNYTAGESISDADTDERYSFEELDRAVRVAQDEITGAETYILTNNKIAVLQSVDLDWVDDGSHLLRTTSASPRAELIGLPPVPAK